MDNLNIHRRKSLTDLRGEELVGCEVWNRFTVHNTPKHGSWLNQAEKIGLFARQCLARRRIPTLAQLQQETAAWNSKVNAEGKKINWTFTRKKARKKFEYKRT